VRQYLAAHSRAPAAAAEAFEDMALSPRRKLIARRMKESLQNIPAIYLFSEVNMDRLEQRKSELRVSGLRVTLTDLLIPIIGEVLTELPQFNATLLERDAETIVRRYRSVNLGLAVSTDQGLVAPVLRDITRKPLAQLVREKDELVARARANRLSPEDITGATFTLTNLGMLDVTTFTALINPPEVAILAVGAVRERVALAGGKPVAMHVAGVCLGVDHRALDGAEGGRFLSRFKACVEDPGPAGMQD
jgi:pyruvate dehydrogenase E2 component (dihydrolipoamide acetyltransferase)